MTFEDPLKVKIELVTGDDPPDISDAASDSSKETSTANCTADSKSFIDDAKAVPSNTSQSQTTTDASLTPWKNRFSSQKNNSQAVNEPASKTAGEHAYRIFDKSVRKLSILTVVGIAFGLIAMPAVPCFFLSFFMYPFFVIRMVLMINSVKQPKRWVSLLRGVIPSVLAATLTTWGLVLAFDALIVAKVFDWVKTFGAAGQNKAFAAVAFGAASLIQVSLIALLLIAIFVFQRLFSWIAARTLETHGVDFGKKKAGVIGMIVGALIGLSGLYSALSVGEAAVSYTFGISSLIWSIGIMIASIFFSEISKIERKTPKT